jgi:hypothetical protein
LRCGISLAKKFSAPLLEAKVGEVMKWIIDAAWRIIRVLPVVGVFIILATSAEVLRRKGYVLGTISLLLDILPVVCLIKALIEICRGDIIPDRPELVAEERTPTLRPAI